MDQSYLKPFVVGSVAAAIDQLYLKEPSVERSLYFGAACALGNYASEYATPLIKMIPMPSISRDLYDAKTLSTRIAEVGGSVGVCYLLNKYVTGNDVYVNETFQRLAVIAVADVAGTYIVEYINNQPLQYLTDHN